MITEEQPVIYIGIGNTDGRLKQREWAELCEEIAAVIDAWIYRHRRAGARLIGGWYSLPATAYLSAVFAVALPATDSQGAEDELRDEMTNLAAGYRQKAIAWVRAPRTEFITPTDPEDPTDAAQAA